MLSPQNLETSLTKAFGRQHAGIAVLLYYKGEQYAAGVNNFSSSSLVQPGCIAKTLTSTLFGIAMLEHGLSLNDALDIFCGDGPGQGSTINALENIRPGQLLNHSSGLDYSTLASLPRDKQGFIKQDVLFQEAHPASITQPGEMFCYSHTGSWLTAFILEQVYQQPYATLLQDKILKPLGISKAHSHGHIQLCPSMGEGLQLSAAALMKLVLWHMHGDPERPGLIDALLSMRTQYPFKITSGLTLKGATAYPVWFDYGKSFGQSGHGMSTSAAIRFLPDKDIAIVVTAEHPQLHNAVLAMLFGDLLPDFKNISIPSLISPSKWKSIDPSVYKGSFENAKHCLQIDTAANGALRGRVFPSRYKNNFMDKTPCIKRYYKAAENHLFIPVEPEQVICPTLQFSHPRDDGKFHYINTGNFIFSRAD